MVPEVALLVVDAVGGVRRLDCGETFFFPDAVTSRATVATGVYCFFPIRDVEVG